MNPPNLYLYRALCTAVHDGDTVTLTVNLGFNTSHTSPFRLLGCNARELAQAGGPEARDNLASLLYGQTVFVQSVKPDKFGDRYDAAIMLPDGRDLVSLLISQQWAVAWNGNGTKPVPPWPRAL